MVMNGNFMYEQDRMRVNKYLHRNESQQYLQYANKRKWYCDMHIFMIYREMMEK
jgi:hypothetical protein